MAHEGPFESDLDREINSIDRADLALHVSNDARTYQRVITALEAGAFDARKIVLNGDSLTREFFISLGCMAWSAGYIEHYHVPIDIINRKKFWSGYIRLKGGGEIFYNCPHYFDKEDKIRVYNETQEMIYRACNRTTTSGHTHQGKQSPFEAYINYTLKRIPKNPPPIGEM